MWKWWKLTLKSMPNLECLHNCFKSIPPRNRYWVQLMDFGNVQWASFNSASKYAEEFGPIKWGLQLSAALDLTLAVNGRELCPGKSSGKLSGMPSYPGGRIARDPLYKKPHEWFRSNRIWLGVVTRQSTQPVNWDSFFKCTYLNEINFTNLMYIVDNHVL